MVTLASMLEVIVSSLHPLSENGRLMADYQQASCMHVQALQSGDDMGATFAEALMNRLLQQISNNTN